MSCFRNDDDSIIILKDKYGNDDETLIRCKKNTGGYCSVSQCECMCNNYKNCDIIEKADEFYNKNSNYNYYGIDHNQLGEAIDNKQL